MISTSTLKALLDAGLSGETLTAVTAAFDADMENVCNLLRNSVTLSDAGSVTPAALRMRKMRVNVKLLKENKSIEEDVTERNNVTSPSVTSDNILSLSKGIEKEESKPVVIARGRKKPDYSERFERFWVDFPADKGMSKVEAWKVWQGLSEEDRELAIAGLPGFRQWIKEQGATYRVVHACRYLSQRRFDGFKSDPVMPVAHQVVVQAGTPQWESWRAYKGKPSAEKDIYVDGRYVRGWWFPTEWPPTQNEQAA